MYLSTSLESPNYCQLVWYWSTVTLAKDLEINAECVMFLQCYTQPAKVDLNKKSFPKQKTTQNFTIDAQGFRKTKNENPPTWEIEVTS